MTKKIFFVISLAVVLLLVAFIWWHSLQPGTASHAESGYVLSIVLLSSQLTRKIHTFDADIYWRMK